MLHTVLSLRPLELGFELEWWLTALYCLLRISDYWKILFQNKTIALDEETKSHKETDAELMANEKRVKELMKALDESREKVQYIISK